MSAEERWRLFAQAAEAYDAATENERAEGHPGHYAHTCGLAAFFEVCCPPERAPAPLWPDEEAS